MVIFSIFSAKKAKKARNLQQIFAKNTFFEFAPERWSTAISTSVWSAQHPNAGRNIQQCVCVRWKKYLNLSPSPPLSLSQALTLTYQEEPRARPPSCTTPQQPTIYVTQFLDFE